MTDVLTGIKPLVEAGGDGAALPCLNCGVALAGPFCAACGQSAATPARVTFRSLWTDFRVNKLGLDRGLFVTVRDILIRPGAVALAFVEGRRRTYVHPVTFLFVAYGVYAIVFGFIGEPMMAVMEANIRAQMADSGVMSPAERAAAVSASLSYMRFSVAYGPYLSILTVLPFGYLLRKLLPGSGRTVAECAVFALTVEGGVALVSGILLNPLVAWTGLVTLSLLSFGLYFLLTGVGAAAFFGRRRGTILRALVAQALALALYMLMQMTGSIVLGIVIAMRSRGLM